MPRRRSRLQLGIGPSLTHRGPAGLVVLGLVRDLVVLGLAGRADLVDRDLDRVRADPADLAVLHPVDLVDIRGRVDPLDPVVLAVKGRAARAGLVVLRPAGLVVRAVLGQAGLVVRALRDRVGPVDPAGLTDIKGLAVREGPVDLAVPAHLDLADRVGPEDQGMGRVGPAARAVLDPADRVGLVDPADRVGLEGQADLAVRVDRHRRRTRPEVLTTGVAHRWVARGMRRTASAHPTTVRRRRPHNADSVGMAGLRPERRRLSGMDHRPRAAGTDHRLPVVGTAHGMVRRAIWQSRSVISGRSITTGTTRSRSSTRSSVDGDSGCSVSGSRCTDTS